MKSIANQYRDLKEGRMSQANFMRNLRMMMPQHITNVTSFNDSVRILKNKGILTENVSGMNLGAIEDDFKNLLSKGYSYSEALELISQNMGIDSDELETMVPRDAVDIEGYEEDEEAELEDLIKRYGEEESGKYTTGGEQFSISEAKKKKKKEAKAELHPNAIHPQELRMGIKVELEHTDDLDKAKKIALDHLAENPFYYTALKLSGIESPSAPKVKAPVEKKVRKKKEAAELVDKENQMQKVKMVKEARLNLFANEEPNEVVKQAMNFVDSNPTLKALSDEIEFQQSMDPNEALLRYDYWQELPAEAIEKLKLQFDVEVDKDFDEDTGTITVYRLTPKNQGDMKDLGGSFDKFKSQLEVLVREVLAEMQSDDQEIDNMAMAMDETFDGRDNLDAKNEDNDDYLEDDSHDVLAKTLKNLSLEDFIKVIKAAGDYNIWVKGAKQMGTDLNDKSFRGETISTFEEDDIERYNQALQNK